MLRNLVTKNGRVSTPNPRDPLGDMERTTVSIGYVDCKSMEDIKNEVGLYSRHSATSTPYLRFAR